MIISLFEICSNTLKILEMNNQFSLNKNIFTIPEIIIHISSHLDDLADIIKLSHVNITSNKILNIKYGISQFINNYSDESEYCYNPKKIKYSLFSKELEHLEKYVDCDGYLNIKTAKPNKLWSLYLHIGLTPKYNRYGEPLSHLKKRSYFTQKEKINDIFFDENGEKLDLTETSEYLNPYSCNDLHELFTDFDVNYMSVSSIMLCHDYQNIFLNISMKIKNNNAINAIALKNKRFSYLLFGVDYDQIYTFCRMSFYQNMFLPLKMLSHRLNKHLFDIYYDIISGRNIFNEHFYNLDYAIEIKYMLNNDLLYLNKIDLFLLAITLNFSKIVKKILTEYRIELMKYQHLFTLICLQFIKNKYARNENKKHEKICKIITSFEYCVELMEPYSKYVNLSNINLDCLINDNQYSECRMFLNLINEKFPSLIEENSILINNMFPCLMNKVLYLKNIYKENQYVYQQTKEQKRNRKRNGKRNEKNKQRNEKRNEKNKQRNKQRNKRRNEKRNKKNKQRNKQRNKCICKHKQKS